MVWGCITAYGMGCLHRIDGIMCGQDYVEILQNDLLRSLKDLKLRKTGKKGIIFQQNNDPKYKSQVAQDWFQAKCIKCLSWPPSSPDMNIIEHVWDQLDALVCTRNPLPCNKEELWEALQEEWYNFPQKAIDTLYESLPCHIAALVKA